MSQGPAHNRSQTYSLTQRLYPFLALVIGLALSQALSTYFVYRSNLELFDQTSKISKAGYLVVPNQQVRSGLKGFGPAFYGGVFFTFTLGAGLATVSLGAAWLYRRLPGRRPWALLPWAGLWVLSIAAANLYGTSLLLNCFLWLVPPAVFLAACHWMPRAWAWFTMPAFLAPLLILGLLGLAGLNAEVFQDLRDKVLWSSASGRWLNNFYYKNTLYPAEVFKSLQQKTLKTSRLPADMDQAQAKRLKSTLVSYDYLPVTEAGPVDLELATSGDALVFKHEGREIFRQKVPDFLADPGRSLERFSRQTDRHRLTRRAVWYSLLFGMPLFCYITLLVLIQAVLLVFIRPAWASTLSGLIVLGLGLYIVVPLLGGVSQVPPGADLAGLIRSESAADRISALRDVIRHKRELADLAGYQALMNSPRIADRYYLALALGQSRKPETLPQLLKLADDPQLNVVCVALSSLGKRRETMAAPVILNKLNTSSDWYIQWYAYQALRALGWVQAQ